MVKKYRLSIITQIVVIIAGLVISFFFPMATLFAVALALVFAIIRYLILSVKYKKIKK